MQVKDIMRKPEVITENISLSEAAGLMTSKGVDSIIFARNDKLGGIVTESDLIRNFGKRETIGDVMTRKVVVIESNKNLEAALALMKEKKIKRLPVVEKGKLVGVITVTDLMAHAEELEEEFLFG